MKKVFCLVLCLSLVLMSCSKDDVDPRDAYVGDFNATYSGNIILSYDNAAVATFPTEGTDVTNITKQGIDELNIGGTIATLSRNTLTVDPITETQSENGLVMKLTTTSTGTAVSGKITLTTKYSGTWTNTNKILGTISGSTIMILTKK